MADNRQRLGDVLREVFEDPSFVVQDELTAADVEGWDSLTHVNVVIAVEHEFGIKLATAEISRTRDTGATLGMLLRMIEEKLSGRS